MALKQRISVLAALVALVGAVRMPAPPPTWVGSGASGDVTLGANWTNGTPLGTGGEDVIFGNLVGSQSNPVLPASGFILHNLTFSDTSRPAYTFSGTSNPTFQLQGDISITTTGGSVAFDSTFNVNLTSGLHTVGLNVSGSIMNVASVVNGAGSVDKSGVGTLTFTGDNTYTGGTTISAGVLQLGSGGGTGSVTGNITNNASLIFNHSGTITYGGNISGTGTVIKTGSGIDTLSGTNSYTGLTTISSGTLAATSLANGGSNSSLGASSNAAANLVIDGGTLQYTGGAVATDRLFTIGTSGATLNASGTGAVNFNNSGSLALSGTNTSRSLTLTGTASGANTLAALVSDNGTGLTSVIKTGTGAWTLSGANTYTGVTTINGGTLVVSSFLNGGSASNIGASSNAAANLLINSGTLQYSGTGVTTDRLFTIGTSNATINASGSGALTFGNTGSLALTGTNTARTLTLSGSNTGTNTLTSTLGDNGSGKTALTKSGTGNWVLGGTNTYTGVTTVSGGSLLVSSIANGGTDSNLGKASSAAANLVLNGGTLKYTGAAQATDRLFTVGTSGGTIDSSGSGVLTFNNSGSMGLSGANTARTLTLAGSSGDGLSQNTLAAVIGDNGTGATTVVKNGTGAWKLTGVNTFSGGLTVNSGTLYLGNGYAAGTGTLTFKDTTSFGISGALSVGNALSLQSGGVRMDITSGSDLVVLTGAVSGSALLSLYGNGTLTLSGSNSGWSGGIMLHDYSVVNANSANAFGVGGLLFDPASDSTVNVNTDLVVRGLAGSSDPSTINITGSYNFTVNQTSDSTYAGYLNGSGNLIKSGTGALTLTNSNNYSGTTTINGGTIIAQGGSYNGQLGNGAVTINSGAKLQVSNSTLYNNVTIQSGGRLQGSGNVNSATITSGGILSAGTPGGIEIGSLGFNDLTLKGGGILEWNLQNPNGSAGTGYDSITISTPSTLHLDGTLSAGTPFTIKVISLTSGGTPGLSTGFAGGAYTWTIFDASSSNIAGTFDSSFFVIDTSGFSSDGGVGNFSFNQSGKLLQLTFTPVPEPTTWAMLISGVGLVGLLRRQRGVRRA